MGEDAKLDISAAAQAGRATKGEDKLGRLCDEVDADTRSREGSPESQSEFEELARTVWRLRQADGCPWDRVQTHESIARNMIEEAYEAVDTFQAHDDAHMREELGDVLLQVLLHAQIAADEGSFDIHDVCRDLNRKLIRRHPHVFGTPEGDVSRVSAESTQEVPDIWDKVKRKEREAKGEATGEEPGLLDSVPISLPALMQAQKISKRAAKASGKPLDACSDEEFDQLWKQAKQEERGQ